MATLDQATLQRLGTAKLKDLPVASVSLLGVAYRYAGDGEASIRWLKAAQLRHPTDLWINYELAERLRLARPPRLAEALQYYRVVRSLRAEMGYVLAITLMQQKESAEALALLDELVRLQPANPWHHLGLGLVLSNKGDVDGAIKEYQEALRLHKDFPE